MRSRLRKRIFHIPVFVPHKGCPHDCVFCNQRTITGQIEEMTPDMAKKIIEEHLSTIEDSFNFDSCHIEIAFFGGSFTAIDSDSQTELLALANSYVKSKRVHGIRLSTRPDAIDDEVLLRCKSYDVTAIELGVQSADDEVLKASGRGHNFSCVVSASELIKKYNIELGLQMMTGLPEDTHDKSYKTALSIAKLEPACVRIYPTLVMEGTCLFEMYKNGSYTPQSLDEAIITSADVAEIFISKNIEILRISLQTTDGVNEKTVIGPYHPSFAELVYSELERRNIEKLIEEKGLKNTTLEIPAAPGMVSKIIGHKKSNKIYFKEKYNIDIKVKQSF